MSTLNHSESLYLHLFHFRNYFDFPTHFLLIVVAFLHGFRSHFEFIVASISILLLWFKTLQFLRGFRGPGVFVRVMFAIAEEIRWFLLVWFVILSGFASAFMLIYQSKNYQFSNFGNALVSCFAGSNLDLFHVFKGDPANTDFEGPNELGLYNLQLVLYVVFTLICNVLLLNMLIALMAEKFISIHRNADWQFRTEKARLMLSLERIFLRSDKQMISDPYLFIVSPVHDAKIVEQDELANSIDQVKHQGQSLQHEVHTVKLKLVEQSADVRSLVAQTEEKQTRQMSDLSGELKKHVAAVQQQNEQLQEAHAALLDQVKSLTNVIREQSALLQQQTQTLERLSPQEAHSTDSHA